LGVAQLVRHKDLSRCVSGVDEVKNSESERNLSPNETSGFATLAVSH